MSSAAQKSRSNCAIALRVRRTRSEKAMMIAQVQMLARSSPSITAFTTQSACRKSATGDSVAASVLKNGFISPAYPPRSSTP